MLGTLEESDWNRTVLIRNQPHSVMQAIHRSLTHAAYHAGQITYVARLLQTCEWNWITIPPGQSKQARRICNREWHFRRERGDGGRLLRASIIPAAETHGRTEDQGIGGDGVAHRGVRDRAERRVEWAFDRILEAVKVCQGKGHCVAQTVAEAHVNGVFEDGRGGDVEARLERSRLGPDYSCSRPGEKSVTLIFGADERQAKMLCQPRPATEPAEVKPERLKPSVLP